MKAFNYIISICIFFLLNACNHPDLDIQFNKESDIVIPAEGGAYYFEVETIEVVETKTSFGNFLRAFEYRVIVGEEIIDQQLLQFSAHNDYIEPGDKFKVDFDIPENVSSEERSDSALLSNNVSGLLKIILYSAQRISLGEVS